MTRRLHRRTVLRGGGAVALGLPWLGAMGCDRDRRAPAIRGTGKPLVGSPARLVVMVTPFGTVPDLWFPTTTLDGTSPATETDFALPSLLAPHEPFRDRMLLVSGVDNLAVPSGHYEAACSLLTGLPPEGPTEQELLGTARSVDHLLGDLLGTLADPPPRPALTLGTNLYLGGSNCVSYVGHRAPAPKTYRGLDLLALLAGGDTETFARTLARRQSLLDEVGGDYRRLRDQLDGEDRQRVELHLESLREVELRLGRRVRACDTGGLAPGEASDAMTQLPEMVRDMIDVLVLALSCDSTRVATYMLRQEGHSARETCGWLGIGPPGDPYGEDSRVSPDSGNHSHLSHYWEDPVAHAKLEIIHRWLSEQVGHLVRRLAETPDGEGTLLDTTTVIHVSAMATGYHDVENLPIAMFGGAHTGLRTGRQLRLAHRAHNDLLLSFFPMLGLPPPPTIGDPTLCTGVIEELFG